MPAGRDAGVEIGRHNFGGDKLDVYITDACNTILSFASFIVHIAHRV